MGDRPFALFLDRAPFHRSKFVKAELEKMKVTRILNVAASPEYNPIEGCFSVVKNHFKHQRLNQLVNKSQVETRQLIRESFRSLKVQQVDNIISYGESLLLTPRDDVASQP